MAQKPNPDIVSYIERHLAKGFDIRHIKRRLAEVGHPIEAIEDATRFVMSKQPVKRKRPPIFMVAYGLVLMIIVAGFVWFIWFKATQQVEYTAKVDEIKKNASYESYSDVELLKLAASGNDMKACDFIRLEDLYYACVNRYWQRNDCTYEFFIGAYDSCMKDKAIANLDTTSCNAVRGDADYSSCRSTIFSSISDKGEPEKCNSNSDCLDYYFSQHNVTLNVSFCDYYKNIFSRDRCLAYVFVNTKQESICEDIDNKRYRSICFSWVVSSPDDALSRCSDEEFVRKVLGQTTVSKEEAEAGCFFSLVPALVYKGSYTCTQLLNFVGSNTNASFAAAFRKVYKDTKESVAEDPVASSNPDTAKFFECDV